MLQYTGAGSGPRFCLYVHHDDAEREYAYDRQDQLARLDQGLDEAAAKGWTVVSMKDDWKQVFPFEVTAVGHPAGTERNDAREMQGQQRPAAQGIPKGFALDATHTPHITMLQCFVRTADLDKLYAAEEKVFAAADVTAMKLEAFKYYYAPTGATGVAGICTSRRRKSSSYRRRHRRRKTVHAGIRSHRRVHGPARRSRHRRGHHRLCVHVRAEDERANFNPHVSTGVAPKDYLDRMLAEPFESFTFSPAGAAVYQLGPYGTAAKQLKEWDLKR